jgi:hypothetical protein
MTRTCMHISGVAWKMAFEEHHGVARPQGGSKQRKGMVTDQSVVYLRAMHAQCKAACVSLAP